MTDRGNKAVPAVVVGGLATFNLHASVTTNEA